MPRTSFNSSGLVRVLTELAVAEVADAKYSFAERLGQWLDFTDAMELFSALNEPGAALPAAGRAPAATGLRGELAQLRATLAESITTDGVLTPGKARVKLPTPAPQATVEAAADFSPYHRYYQAHQRDMSAAIGPLRARARAALARRSAADKRLAALDAAMDEALAVRERNLLATLPLLLAKRFAHLYKAHQAALGELPDDPAQWLDAGGWLAGFCRDMQAVLLAELEVRLLPAAGLIEALEPAGESVRQGNEVTKS